MSVNNVNSMYQTQGVQNGSAYTYQASDNSESGVDIGKLLLGAGAAIAIGVTTCAAAKKGKTVSGDNGFFTNVVNGVKSWFGKNTGVKRYVDLGDDINSLTNSQKIEKAQEIVDAAKNNLQVSNDKAIKHMKNIEVITDSLSKGKIDDEIFTKINNTKGLEDAFELKNGELTINGDNGLKKVKAYFSKGNDSKELKLESLKENDSINVETLESLFGNKSDYYVTKQESITDSFNQLNHIDFMFDTKTANNLLNDFGSTVNKKLDFQKMAETDYYKANTDLFTTRAKAKGFDDQTIKEFIENAKNSKSEGG